MVNSPFNLKSRSRNKNDSFWLTRRVVFGVVQTPVDVHRVVGLRRYVPHRRRADDETLRSAELKVVREEAGAPITSEGIIVC